MYELALFFPPRAKQIGVFARYSVCDGETKWSGNLQSLFPVINGSGKDADALFCERGTALSVSTQKADAVGSPVAPIEQHDREFGVDIPGQFQGATVCQVQG
ncbi:MAG: hypothetical protein OXI79_10650 [Gammaproteobacteria bacterium]|nr:hypothetical protein [Gammaproteobacteria bacterium]